MSLPLRSYVAREKKRTWRGKSWQFCSLFDHEVNVADRAVEIQGGGGWQDRAVSVRGKKQLIIKW
jgi:hypothetical protein